MKSIVTSLILAFLLSGCAALNGSGSKELEMTKSPCACIGLPLING